jgi:hypothetical protein
MPRSGRRAPSLRDLVQKSTSGRSIALNTLGLADDSELVVLFQATFGIPPGRFRALVRDVLNGCWTSGEESIVQAEAIDKK